MDVRPRKRRCLLTATLGIGLALTLQAGHAQEFGPLPELKVNAAKAALGKRLFYDPRLSGDAAISCATCHKPEHGFATADALSEGYPGNLHFRNSQSLINVGHKKSWLHDGRIGTDLNDVTREMITETYLMNMDMRIMQERLKQDPVYVQMFKDAGMSEPSNGGARSSIPEFLKTLTSRNAPFDRGQLSAAAKKGFELFKGKAGCAQCHSGPLFSDGQAHNTGVPENLDVFLDPARHQAFLAYALFMGVENLYNLKRDPGAHVRTHKADGSDLGKFMTPSLRELKQTAPYMHNGMLATLTDVVEFYDQGGGADSHKSPLLKPLQLSAAEKRSLVAFLEALSGDPLIGPEYVWQEPYPTDYPAIPNWRQARN